ncbi:alpha-glucuronidase [Enterococcus timonensis]|uniref:alpha-glucuronidase n=1 Tax=Enterococcus timonensis TaxID=1852364 RepID=UPI0008D9A0A7|nr:alpha-glucuronidase [Enterococcus timonensis]
MKISRDSAWLSKKVQEKYSFYFDENQKLATTLKNEIKELFPESNFSTLAKCDIELKIDILSSVGLEGFHMEIVDEKIVVSANTSEGLLYGFFHLYEMLVLKKEIKKNNYIPQQSIRMINHWDNADGSVERGYAGQSIFYENGAFKKDLEIVTEYARFLASVGINAISINNVNVHEVETKFITKEYLPEVKRVADQFAAYGIQTYLSLNYAAPVEVGDLKTADPLDSEVIQFWEETVKNIYEEIPDFGGFVVKADSENRPGPFTYGRNHDEGANVLARALKHFGGKVIWRCFVYNCAQDWRDRSTDRAKAAYDNFMPLDGNFDDNVILQIKNGPIDFQVREPISPLFGSLQKTNQILEFQIAQEYTGQQLHICYLLPMWKEVLDFSISGNNSSPVKRILAKNSPQKQNSGIAAVVNVGMDNNWTGHKLAQANLYGYGKIIWDNDLTAEEIANDWLELSFTLSKENKEKLSEILLHSRQTYEDYTAPLGIGFMVEPNHHYGPNVDGYEYSRWGTYHFADRNGIGVDRTQKTGTGYTQQYLGEHQKQYENIATCPDNLLLFFHHVPYDHVLQSGKTVIQHIYDTHFSGFQQALIDQKIIAELSLELDQASAQNLESRLQEQVRCAREWRDQINTYFYRKSGVEDELGRLIYR